jgi:hypothetical protein
MKSSFVVVSIALCLAVPASSALAQQRPLVTEDPETIGSGLVLLEGGFDILRDVVYPVSGLEGNLLRVPTLGVSLGISSIAEIQVDGAIYNRLNITGRRPAPRADVMDFTGDRTSDIEDLVVGTKVRLVSEGAERPAFGVRFATRLPNASSESGLGSDTMDFFASALVGKTVQSIRFVGNVGIAVVDDPAQLARQNDMLTYGFSVARAVAQGLEVVGEINGRLDVRDGEAAPGTESRGAMRIGGRFTRGTVRVDSGVIIGLTAIDPAFGFTAGFTWVFRGFSIP